MIGKLTYQICFRSGPASSPSRSEFVPHSGAKHVLLLHFSLNQIKHVPEPPPLVMRNSLPARLWGGGRGGGRLCFLGSGAMSLSRKCGERPLVFSLSLMLWILTRLLSQLLWPLKEDRHVLPRQILPRQSSASWLKNWPSTGPLGISNWVQPWEVGRGEIHPTQAWEIQPLFRGSHHSSPPQPPQPLGR